MNTNSKFKKLFEPGSIGKIRTRNRIIKTGASMLYWHEDETSMNQDTLAFYEALAKGGVGLIVVESPIIDYPRGARWRERYRMDDDKYIKGMSELTEVIHKYGCPTFMQMNHDGPWQSPLFPNLPATFEGPPIASSPVNLPGQEGDFHRDVPRELTIEEIEEIIDKCASAAVRAQKAGFDGLDINAGSSHLFHNFLSPFWNKRQDAYGGSVEKRAKLLIDTVKEIKKRNGQDFPVIVCLSGIEIGQAIGISNNDCQTHENVKKVTLLLQEAGADAIHVRSHWLGYHVGGFLTEQLFFPEFPVPLREVPKEYNAGDYGKGANLRLAESIKKTVTIPVIIVGRVEAELGEKILRSGKADFIAMHRPLMADPEYPNKVASGKLDEIRPCTRCGNCLDQSREMHRRCRINAALGTNKYSIDKAGKRKKVMVIGGGPAGMEAARVSALRGHDVSFYEKASKLGGLMPIAAVVKGLEIEDLPAIIRYFKVQFKKLGVKTKLGKAADLKTIEKIKPDVVICAEGGIVYAPDIPGIDKRNVVTGPELHKRLKFFLRFFSPGLLRWLTNFYLPLGKKVIIIGSGLHGLEVAEFLIKRRRKVTIIDTAEVPGEGMLDYRLGLIFPWLEKKDVRIINKLKAIEVVDKGVAVITENGEKQIIEADTVVTALPSKPNMAMYDSLKGRVPEVYTVGDCEDPNMIVDAIRTGWATAKEI